MKSFKTFIKKTAKLIQGNKYQIVPKTFCVKDNWDVERKKREAPKSYTLLPNYYHV